MTCAIVYSSRTGNTRRLAETVQASLPQACLYMGPPDDAALAADRLYIGFWTDKGTCDAGVADFLSKVSGKEVFLFGTAGVLRKHPRPRGAVSGTGKHGDRNVHVPGPHAHGSAGAV